jgi:hypothetical protein
MPNTILKRWNGSTFEELYPKTTTSQIAASGTPSSSTFLRGDGTWATAGNTVKLTVTTAAATAAKTTTESVTFAEDVPYLVLFTLGNSVSSPTLNGINIRLSTSNASTTTFSLGANSLVPMYYNATTNVMQITGSYRTSDSTEDYNLRWENSVTAGAQITRYKLIMEGIDGRFYPLTIGDTTAATKTVSTQQFRLNGTILMYNTTTTQAENATFSNVWVSEYSSGRIHYTFNQSSGFVAYRSVYLKGTINSNGHFVLDNTTLTSWLTQTLPTTDDGFVYVYLGITNNTTTAFRLEVTHPIYEFKDGKLRQYTPTHTHPYSDLTGTVPTWNQDTTGSAATLTTARTLTIGSTGKTFNGGANVSWTLAEIGAQDTIVGGASSVVTNNLATLRALVSDSSGKIAAAGSTTATEISYVNGVTSNIQTQLNGKAATSHTHTVGNISDRGNIGNNLMLLQNTTTSTRFLKLNPDHSVSLEADSTFRTSIGAAATSHTHTIANITGLQTALDGKSNTDHVHAINDVANLQTTLDGKQATITGAATTITGSNLTAFRVLGSDVSGKVAATSITTSTLAFLDATSSVQTQLNGKAATSHTHGNITSAGAIGSTANLGVVTTTSGVLTTRTINDSSVLAVLSNSSTALTTERDVYWGTRYIHLGVTSVAGNGVSRTITFTAGMRNFILQLHQDTTTGAVIARLPLTISNSSGTSTVTSVQSLDTFSRTHRVAWSNGGGAQILNVTISYSGTTITVSQNFNFNCAFRLFGF